ncbi:glucose dehydrogenase [FAD, quinone]-like [Periplaneta americana]|uniref:glucose dehydrogenase [FAD, quinone]-like n=1 Tax=Periplaneta americana TaxID=6978 RepID=UPI0037E81FCC
MDCSVSSGACGCSFEDTSFLTSTAVCPAGGLTIFLGLVECILRQHCDISYPCHRIVDTPDTTPNTYDFIVVGAGVAGPVVASRLSEVSHWHVLLLEAGPEEPTASSVPAFATSAIGTDLDWKYTTEPSSNACLSTGGRCYWPRGKMVSGSSGMQGMMYTRPHYSILDEWGKDNPGWSYKETLPYFIKSENNLNPELVEPEYHGFRGPLPVQQFPSRPHIADAMVLAGKQLGFNNGDLNGHNQTGVAIAQMMVYEGLRASTARMYLRPYLSQRKNLKVLINSHVTKVLMNPATMKASGVQYLDKKGNVHTVQARKEVILSAGAVNSPQLLLLSGIGPSADLQDVGIKPLLDLPGVGHNLHNHASGRVHYYMNDPGTQTLTLEALEEFVTNRTGPLASTGLTQTTVVAASKYAKDGVPDLQLFFNGYWAQCSETGTPEECELTGQLGNCPPRELVARPTLVYPHSRGYLKLNTSNPLDHPLIFPNYLDSQHDVDVIVEGIKLCIALSKTPALQEYGVTVNPVKSKACEAYDFGTDEFFACEIRQNLGPENHQAGSCKMGPAKDNMAVVDKHLKVHGVTNLRVVDASIFPRVPNSNPTSVIVMAAEKVSDLIKSSWKEKASKRIFPHKYH